MKITSLPSHGTLTYDGQPIRSGDILSPNGTYTNGVWFQTLPVTYTPDAGYLGMDSFNWTGSDQTFPDHFAATPATVSISEVAPPTVSSFSKSVSLYSPGSFSLPDFTSHYVSSNLPLQYITITSLPVVGSLLLYGAPVSLNAVIPAASIPSLTFKASEIGSDVFSFTAGGGVFTSRPANVVLHVTSTLVVLNRSGIVLSNGSFLVGVNGAAPALVPALLFTGSAPAQGVKITRLPSAGQLIVGGNAIHAGQVLTPVQFIGLTYKALHPGATDSFKFNIFDGNSFADVDATFSFLTSASALRLSGNNHSISSNGTPSVTNFTDFGNWTTNPDRSILPDTRTFTITNNGIAALHPSRAIFTGPNANDFSLLSAPDTLAPGQSTTIVIRFLPRLLPAGVSPRFPFGPSIRSVPSSCSLPAPASPQRRSAPIAPLPRVSYRSVSLSPAKAPGRPMAISSPSPTPVTSPTARSWIPRPLTTARAMVLRSASTTRSPAISCAGTWRGRSQWKALMAR